MAEAAAKTKSPSNVQSISSEDMQTFIDVLNSLALGPVYTSRTTGTPQQLIQMGGVTGGAPMRAQIVSPGSDSAERFVSRGVSQAVPSYSGASEATSTADKPGISLKDFVDILNTLKASTGDWRQGYKATDVSVAQPGAGESSRVTMSGTGPTAEASQEDVLGSLQYFINLLAKQMGQGSSSK